MIFVDEILYHKKQDELDYLRFTAATAGATISMKAVTDAPAVSLETSFDGIIWTPFTPKITTITLANIGDYVFFRGNNTRFCSNESAYNYFAITGNVYGSGNIMSIVDETMQAIAVATYCFEYLFRDCDGLLTPPRLPATTLGRDCYNGMFMRSGISICPDLPATALKQACYRNMFNYCNNLRLSTAQSDAFKTPFRIPTSGNGTTATNALSTMFNGVSGGIPATPTINTTYYGAW